MTSVMLYTSVPPADRGGVETVLASIRSRLQEEGVATTEVRTGRKAGTDLCGLRTPNDPRFSIHLRSFLRAARRLLRYRPDVVNIHFITDTAIYFVLLKAVFGYRLVVSAHGSDVRRPRPKSVRYLSKILRAADVVTVVSEEMRAHVLKQYEVDPERLVVVRNGVDTDFWSPGGERSHGATLVSAGRLETVKGIDTMIRAMPGIRERVPDVRLVVVGDGSQREALEELALACGVSEHVEFRGFLGRQGVLEAYRGADLFVMPSQSEGFPIALLEAMSTGLSFVCSDVGGVGEIATAESGRCVEPGNVDGFVRSVSDMLTGGGLIDAGRAARRRALDFSVTDTLDLYSAILRNEH